MITPHMGMMGRRQLRGTGRGKWPSPNEKEKLKVASITRVVREFVWPRRGLLSLGLILILINRLSGLVLPGASKFLIDDVVQQKNLKLLTPLALICAGAVLIQAITSFSLTQLISKMAQRLIADLRIKVQQHVGRLPVRYYDANKTGSLISRIMSDVEGIRNLVGTGLVELIGGLITAIVALGLLLSINTLLTMVIVGFLTLFGIGIQKAFASIRPIFRERSAIQAEVTGRLSESLSGVRVVKGFHAESREASTFAAGAMRIFQNIAKTLTATSLMRMSGTLLMGIISIIVMVAGARMILREAMTIGDFVAFSLYLGLLIAPVVQIVNIGSQLTEALAGLDRMHEVLAEKPEDVDPDRTVGLGDIAGHIRFREVTFEYVPDKPVLHGISLESFPGTVTALVGSSGSGKSTLINLVAAFAKPTTGKIQIDGVDLSTVKLDSYRSQLGVVLQDNFLFDGTIRENILFGRPDAPEGEMMTAAEVARVDEFVQFMEQGYDTVIGERGVKLSGGQRQRVAIARAILADPKILILDEATSSLDTESESMIQEGLAALIRDRTTFVIAHRLSTIRRADQILVLEGGDIVERGTHDQLLAREGRYFELYTKQVGIEENRFVNPGEKESEPEEEQEEQEDYQHPSPVGRLGFRTRIDSD